MSMTTLLGLSFGVFPCLLFGFIMLLSLLICEYIEEYVAKHLCAWKNRRRRGLRSFYQDFRLRRSPHAGGGGAVQHYSSRSRSYSATAWVDGGGSGEVSGTPDGPPPFSPTAPPSERSPHGAQLGFPVLLPLSAANDPPPSYEECVLPRRQPPPPQNVAPSSQPPPQPKKPSLKKSFSVEAEDKKK